MAAAALLRPLAVNDTTTPTVRLDGELRGWIEQIAGGTVERAERTPGGGRREAWVIDVHRPDGAMRELFLRYDRARPAPYDPYTLHREAEVYLALGPTAVPVPHVVGVHPTHQAILSNRVEGDTWFSRLRDEAARLSVARDFMTKLAALHRLEPSQLDLPSFGTATDARRLVERELDIWDGIYRHTAVEPEPLAELGLDWLRRNVPQYDGPIVLVQGDTGPGNFLYRDGRVTAVLDWELAHLGDPMEDLGWLALRAVQEPFTHLPDRLREYETLSGHPLDLARIRYHRVFAELRVVILGVGRKRGRNLLGEVGNGLIYGALHNRLFVEAMAEVLGVTLEDPALPSPEPSEADWLFEAALAQLRDIISPHIGDPFATLRAKGLARILKYLREANTKAGAYEAEELGELGALLGRSFDSLSAGRAALVDAIREHTLDEAAVLECLWRRVARETDLAREAMGALAARHFDPLC